MGSLFLFANATRKAITVPVKELDNYTGTYNQIGQPGQLNILVKNGKLYFNVGGQPLELTPFTKDGFFRYEDEKMDISFQTEGGKMYIVVTPYGQQPMRMAERISRNL